MVKLLPNSMDIDLDLKENNSLHPKLIKYYEAIIENNMIMLVHVGEEHSVSAGYHTYIKNKLN